MTIAISTGVVRGTEEQDESFGQKLKLAEISGSESYSPDVRKIIDLGLDKATNQRLMVGASEGCTYKGQMRKGVTVFDFKIGRTIKSEQRAGFVIRRLWTHSRFRRALI